MAFHANRGFHIRDSGLIARHLRLLGLESKCIMPLPYYDDDTERDNLIRVEMEKLRDPEWWRSLGIDGVVLYSWAAPRYGAIARAIRRACQSIWTPAAISGVTRGRMPAFSKSSSFVGVYPPSTF